MKILIHRIYDDNTCDGYRVLVDRLWPRCVRKEQAALDEWCKALAPSPQLRIWFGHAPGKWREFSKRYKAELKIEKDEAHALLMRARQKYAGRKPLVLLYGAKDKDHTHAIILKEFLDGLS